MVITLWIMNARKCCGGRNHQANSSTEHVLDNQTMVTVSANEVNLIRANKMAPLMLLDMKYSIARHFGVLKFGRIRRIVKHSSKPAFSITAICGSDAKFTKTQNPGRSLNF